MKYIIQVLTGNELKIKALLSQQGFHKVECNSLSKVQVVKGIVKTKAETRFPGYLIVDVGGCNKPCQWVDMFFKVELKKVEGVIKILN
jgi:transcription antitermination factor NusG